MQAPKVAKIGHCYRIYFRMEGEEWRGELSRAFYSHDDRDVDKLIQTLQRRFGENLKPIRWVHTRYLD